MVKVGDKLVVTGPRGHMIRIGSEVTVVEVHLHSLCGMNYRVEDERGLRQWVYNDDLRPISPPQKITQNGYEYSLVGPVKPEWLVDGAWVVRKDNGETHQINQQSENMFSATSSLSRVTGLTVKRVSEEFRPHTTSDWKWGDWAMYAGRKVFVIERGNWKGDIRVSHPDLPDRVAYVPVLQLTPTF